MKSVSIQIDDFGCSTGDPDHDGFAFVYCVGQNRYCVSLSRFPADSLVEVMVRDQLNHKTAHATVTLAPGRLQIDVPKDEAARLNGVARHVVLFPATASNIRDLDAALRVIFSSSALGTYVNRCGE